MQQAIEGRAKSFFRAAPSSAFDQYLQDIQRLPLIDDPEEERRLARRAQQGDNAAAERLVTANLRFVISYVKKYQGHGLDLSELDRSGSSARRAAVQRTAARRVFVWSADGGRRGKLDGIPDTGYRIHVRLCSPPRESAFC